MVYRYVFRLDANENEKLLAQFEQSGIHTKADFIRSIIFKRKVKVVKIDKKKHDFYMRLTTFYKEFKAVGVNYNQVVKRLHTTFSEREAKRLLLHLERQTIKLAVISQNVIRLIIEFEEKCMKE